MTEQRSSTRTADDLAIAIERLIFKHVQVRELFDGSFEFVGTSAAADTILAEVNSRAQGSLDCGAPAAWLAEYDGRTDATTDGDTVRIWRDTLGRKITPLFPPAQQTTVPATCDDLGGMLHDYDYGTKHEADADMIGEYRRLAAAIMAKFEVLKPASPSVPSTDRNTVADSTGDNPGTHGASKEAGGHSRDGLTPVSSPSPPTECGGEG